MKDEFSAYIGEQAILADQGFVSAREFAAIIASALWPTYSDKGKCSVTQLAWEKRLPEEIRVGRICAYNPITKEQLIPPQEGMAWGYDTNPQLLLDYLLSVREAVRLAEVSGIKLTVGGPADQAEEIAAARSKIAELEARLAMEKVADAPKNPGSFANSSYSTSWLVIQWAAVEKFFKERGSVDAKKEEVVEWIIEEAGNAGLSGSKNIAEAIFTIIKPSDHDPRKRRG